MGDLIIDTELEFNKSTPGTYRYLENPEAPTIRNLYIVKEVMHSNGYRAGDPPQRIRVTVEVLED